MNTHDTTTPDRGISWPATGKPCGWLDRARQTIPSHSKKPERSGKTAPDLAKNVRASLLESCVVIDREKAMQLREAHLFTRRDFESCLRKMCHAPLLSGVPAQPEEKTEKPAEKPKWQGYHHHYIIQVHVTLAKHLM